MENLTCQFLQTYNEKVAVDLVRLSRCSNFYYLGALLGNYLEKIFPHNLDIKEEQSICQFYSNDLEKAYFTTKRILSLRGLNQEQAKRNIFNRHFSIDAVKNRYIYYDPMRMRKILNRPNKDALVTFTITSCKRLDLFLNTVNSFVNCCKDIELIGEWFCVDDNSSEEDRIHMKQMYPFMNFYFKNPDEKGHPQSMNIIRNHVKTPYLFHMEDDWCFFERRNYISECLEVLGQDSKIGQCLINKNYAETKDDDKILGGIFATTPSGLRYYRHEYCPTDEEMKKFHEKYGNGPQCAYWPHFSFRPSLCRTSIIQELGEYNETISHFEMEYSYRYINAGYESAFLETVYCLHTGRLTSERHDQNKLNAYDLNGEAQLSGKEEQIKNNQKHVDETDEDFLSKFPFKMKTFVINLDRRPDRWSQFQNLDDPKPLKYERFSAIDGSKLKPTLQLQQIFDFNDYNMRQGMVGCAMSHIKLYIQLLQDEETDVYCILEDDLEFVPDFDSKLLFCAKELHKTKWDMFYLGHHLWKQFIDNEVYSKSLWPKVEQFDRAESLRRSMGGTGGYMITKKGAERLLEFINRTGMTNGIDTVQQKAADELNIFYAYPHLIYSECFRGDNSPDTDIQHNHTSLTISITDRLEEELKYYEGNITKIENINNIPSSLPIAMYYEIDNQSDFNKIVHDCPHLYYTISNKFIFMVPFDNGRYLHRFKKNGKWNIDDSLSFVN